MKNYAISIETLTQRGVAIFNPSKKIQTSAETFACNIEKADTMIWVKQNDNYYEEEREAKPQLLNDETLNPQVFSDPPLPPLVQAQSHNRFHNL